MKKAIAIITIMLFVVGCSSDSGSSEVQSSYKGQWTGTMTNNNQTVPATGNATVNMNVDKNGAITAVYDVVNLNSYYAVGSISETGTFSLLPDMDVNHNTIVTMVFQATSVTSSQISGNWSDSSRGWTGTFVLNKAN